MADEKVPGATSLIRKRTMNKMEKNASSNDPLAVSPKENKSSMLVTSFSLLPQVQTNQQSVIPKGSIILMSNDNDNKYQKILNELGGEELTALQIGTPTITMTQDMQDGGLTDDVIRKKQMRLLKNREAAKECRRKKKEYIQCLENRVAVLEKQNKALVDEIKSLKEQYSKQKTE